MSGRILFGVAVVLAVMTAQGGEPRYVQQSPLFVDVSPHTREAVLGHLLKDHNAGKKFTAAQLDLMTTDELFALHADIHGDVARYDLLPQARPAVLVATSDQTAVSQKVALRQTCVLLRNANEKRYALTGVLVSRTGGVSGEAWILTAKHGGLGQDIVAATARGVVRATKAASTRYSEGAVAFKVATADPLDTLRIADSIPERGGASRYGGFAGAQRLTDYLEGTATLNGGATLQAFPGVRVNASTNHTTPGMSGCPLVNERGELWGLNHGSERSSNGERSLWIRLDDIKDVFATATNSNQPARRTTAVPTKNEPRMVVFSREGCQPCAAWEHDARAGLLGEPSRNAIVVKLVNGQWMECESDICRPSQLAADFQRATRQQVNGTPTFWFEGTTHFRSGYQVDQYGNSTVQTRNSFCSWIKNVFAAIGRMLASLFGVGAEPSPVVVKGPPLQEGGDPILGIEGPLVVDPVPLPREVPVEDIDWGYVTIVGWAKEDRDITGIRGLGRKTWLEKGRSVIHERINSLLDGKAHLEPVFERLGRERYAASVLAAGVNPNPVAIGVLVRKLQDVGLVKSIIEGKVTKVLEGYIPEGLPIKIIFEKTNSDLYGAVIASLHAGELTEVVPELPREPEPVVSPLNEDSLLSKVKQAAGSAIADAMNAKLAPLDDALKARVDAIEARAIGAEEDRSFLQKLLAGIGVGSATGAGAFGLRHWLRQKAIDKVHEKLASVLGRDEAPAILRGPVRSKKS